MPIRPCPKTPSLTPCNNVISSLTYLLPLLPLTSSLPHPHLVRVLASYFLPSLYSCLLPSLILSFSTFYLSRFYLSSSLSFSTFSPFIFLLSIALFLFSFLPSLHLLSKSNFSAAFPRFPFLSVSFHFSILLLPPLLTFLSPSPLIPFLYLPITPLHHFPPLLFPPFPPIPTPTLTYLPSLPSTTSFSHCCPFLLLSLLISPPPFSSSLPLPPLPHKSPSPTTHTHTPSLPHQPDTLTLPISPPHFPYSPVSTHQARP